MTVKLIGPRDPRDPDAINTTSRSKNWSRGLSPFFLGPVKLYGKYVSKNVENGWQYSKVYSEHVGKNGMPTDEYFEWAQNGWREKRANRYPMGKGREPEFSHWDGENLTYVEARRKIYIPLYSKAVVKTEAFERLKMIYETMREIVLWDFDAYDHRAFGMSWNDVIDDPNKKMGHGFVLAMLLTNFIKIENDNLFFDISS